MKIILCLVGIVVLLVVIYSLCRVAGAADRNIEYLDYLRGPLDPRD